MHIICDWWECPAILSKWVSVSGAVFCPGMLCLLHLWSDAAFRKFSDKRYPQTPGVKPTISVRQNIKQKSPHCSGRMVPRLLVRSSEVPKLRSPELFLRSPEVPSFKTSRLQDTDTSFKTSRLEGTDTSFKTSRLQAVCGTSLPELSIARLSARSPVKAAEVTASQSTHGQENTIRSKIHENPLPIYPSFFLRFPMVKSTRGFCWDLVDSKVPLPIPETTGDW